jgi:hypothetical protein
LERHQDIFFLGNRQQCFYRRLLRRTLVRPVRYAALFSPKGIKNAQSLQRMKYVKSMLNVTGHKMLDQRPTREIRLSLMEDMLVLPFFTGAKK